MRKLFFGRNFFFRSEKLFFESRFFEWGNLHFQDLPWRRARGGVIGYRLAPLSVTGYDLNYQGYHDLS